MTITTTASSSAAPRQWYRGLWNRQLEHYPNTGPRIVYLGITLIITIVLYYQAYVQGAVAADIMRKFNFTFTQFTYIGVIALAVGALASYVAGLADRVGRTNIVVGGLLLTAVLVTFGLPNAGDKVSYGFLYSLVMLVEGIVLVATPALVRDFTPQVGRAVAMGFWMMGPVLGSVIVTEVSSHTLADHSDWRWQFWVAGGVGFGAFVLALVGLRELSPRLRDQLMVSMRDRALVEARAAGIDPETALKGHFRQMLRLDIIGSSLAVGLYQLFYSTLVSLLALYLSTIYGLSTGAANSVANWYWVPMAIALAVMGVASDWIRVRKPFIMAGVVVSLVAVALFAQAATHPGTSMTTMKTYLVIAAIGQAMVSATWLAAFTETVEKRNPAATATGLAVWGSAIRVTLTIAFAIIPFAMPATTTLVDQAPKLQAIMAQYPGQMAVLQTVDPVTLATLTAHPNDATAQVKALSEVSGKPAEVVDKAVTLGVQYSDQLATAAAIDPALLATLAKDPTNAQAAVQAVQQVVAKRGVSAADAVTKLQALATVPPADLAFLQANGSAVQQAATRIQSVGQIPPADIQFLKTQAGPVQQAAKDNPEQWQHWWLVCLIAQLVFVPSVLWLTGRWSPAKAREDEIAHDRAIEAELAQMQSATTE